MRPRHLAPLLALALLVGACGDDDGGDPAASSVPAVTTPPSTAVVGPTEGAAACADLADRYVQRARALFDRQGTPSDAVVDRARARMGELDAIASTAGCGEAYVTGVCEGLDELTAEGILVIHPLTTARCL